LEASASVSHASFTTRGAGRPERRAAATAARMSSTGVEAPTSGTPSRRARFAPAERSPSTEGRPPPPEAAPRAGASNSSGTAVGRRPSPSTTACVSCVSGTPSARVAAAPRPRSRSTRTLPRTL